MPIIIARGIISEKSPRVIQSTGLTPTRVGDKVYNLTDDSQGIVSAVFPAINTIEIQKLSGGKTNVFQKGDIFQVDMQEKTRDAIDFYPQLTREDSRTVYVGKPTSFMLTEDNVMFSIAATIPEHQSEGFNSGRQLVLNLGDAAHRLVFDLQCDPVQQTPYQLSELEDDTRFILNLVDENDKIVAVGARKEISAGVNRFYFPYLVQLEEGMNYSVQITATN